MSYGEVEGEVAFFSAKRWDRRNRADLIESVTPCHKAQLVGLYRDSNPLRLTVLAAMPENYTRSLDIHNTLCKNIIVLVFVVMFILPSILFNISFCYFIFFY